MGQKVDPRGFRVGVIKSWPCEWFAKNSSQNMKYFIEDIKIRKYFEKNYTRLGVGKIIIRKTEKDCEIVIFTGKPAVFLGKDGKKILALEETLNKLLNRNIKLVIKEIKIPELSAKIMAEFACDQLEKRMPYRRVAKNIIQKIMGKGAIGTKISIGGRLGGVDLARTEKFSEGRLPLQTLRADIDYHYTTALTKYGILGVKVWIYKGDIYSKKKVKKTKKLNNQNI